MEARRRKFYRSMVAAPALFILSLGVASRASYSAYEFPEYGYRDTQRLNAFLQVVRETESVIAVRKPLDVDLLAAGRLWIKKYRSGELVSVIPAFYGDTSNDGVKDTIATAALRLSERMLIRASRERDPIEAISMASTAAEMLHPVREFDLFMTIRSSQALGRALEIIRARKQDVTTRQWSKLEPNLQRLFFPEDLLTRLLRRNRDLLAEEKERLGEQASRLVETDRFLSRDLLLTTSLSGTKLPTLSAKLANRDGALDPVADAVVARQLVQHHNNVLGTILARPSKKANGNQTLSDR